MKQALLYVYIYILAYHNRKVRTRNADVSGRVGLFINENINFKIREDPSIFIPHYLNLYLLNF